jgi:hypothetical protein
MLGSSWVAAQLVAAQEGLSSMSEFSEWEIHKGLNTFSIKVINKKQTPFKAH